MLKFLTWKCQWEEMGTASPFQIATLQQFPNNFRSNGGDAGIPDLEGTSLGGNLEPEHILS